MTQEWRPGVRRSFCLSGKLAVSSAQHHPLVRELRGISKQVALPIIKDVLANASFLLPGCDRENIGVAVTPDATLFRMPGDKQKGIWHRDFAQGSTTDKDLLFGGWINTDENDDQFFRCVPGSHLEQGGTSSDRRMVCCPPGEVPRGFHKQEEHETSAATIAIPPGHILIFFENILHTVLPTDWKRRKDPTRPMTRLFTGFHVTTIKADAAFTLYGPALHKSLGEQGILPIKGGCRLLLAPKHTGTHTQQNRRRATEWIASVGLHSQAADVMKKYLAGGSERGDGICPSLQAMGIIKFPEYTEAEKAAFLLEPIVVTAPPAVKRQRLWTRNLKTGDHFAIAKFDEPLLC